MGELAIHQRMRNHQRASRAACGFVWTVGLTLSIAASAKADNPSELSPEARVAAAEAAYDRGSKAYVAGQFDRAAAWYETADRMAPSANALIQAIRAYERAGNTLRAGTLALTLERRYGAERMHQHTTAIAAATKVGYRVNVVCEQCTLQVDSETEEHFGLFLAPDTEHVIVARFETGTREEKVAGPPGAQRDLRIEPPKTPPPVAEFEKTSTPAPVTVEAPGPSAFATPARKTSRSGLSPTFVVVGGAVTALGVGVGLWSSLDTLSQASDYEKNPTQEGLDHGRGLELRTNLIWAGTAVVGVATLATALFFTDWGGKKDVAAQKTGMRLNPSVGTTSVGLLWEGTLP